jgi:hypothetical protein
LQVEIFLIWVYMNFNCWFLIDMFVWFQTLFSHCLFDSCIIVCMTQQFLDRFWCFIYFNFKLCCLCSWLICLWPNSFLIGFGIFLFQFQTLLACVLDWYVLVLMWVSLFLKKIIQSLWISIVVLSMILVVDDFCLLFNMNKNSNWKMGLICCSTWIKGIKFSW